MRCPKKSHGEVPETALSDAERRNSEAGPIMVGTTAKVG